MSEGFGMLTSLKNLNMGACTSVKSLPESELRIFLWERCLIVYVSNFGYFGLTVVPPMSEGFGMLTSLQSLNMYHCFDLGSLQESESRLN